MQKTKWDDNNKSFSWLNLYLTVPLYYLSFFSDIMALISSAVPLLIAIVVILKGYYRVYPVPHGNTRNTIDCDIGRLGLLFQLFSIFWLNGFADDYKLRAFD